MSEKFDDELDFDDDFGDFDMDPFSEPPMPKGRSPITHSLLKTGRKFTESFTDDKIDTARKFADASIPSEISGEAYDIKRILGGAQEGYREAINEVRKEAKPFFSAMDNVIPKGGKLETLVNFAKEKMGVNDTAANYEQLAEDSATKAAAAVGELLGQQRTKEEYHNLVRDNIRTKRELSGLEIAATTASNLEFINKFNQEVVSKYQRKSLELQYRHLYTADEQLAVTKTAFDGFKNQLESIVINSALPELTKMHNSEFIKAKLYDKLTDGLFSKEGTVGALRNKFMQEIKGIGTAVAGGMEAATSGLEQYDNFKEMSKMVGGTEGIVASLLADGLINVVGRKTGDIISKTKPGKKMVDYIRNVMLDPSEQFRKDAESKEGGFLKSLFSMASDFTRVNDGERIYSLSNGDGRDAAVFDNNTQTSITKTIPGYLAKILASVDGIRTGTTQEELRYDRDTGTFETISETRSKIKSSIEKDLNNSGVKRNLRYMLDDIEKKMSIKFTKEEKADFREGILNYVYSGKSLHPDMLEENGFYRGFSRKTALKLKLAIGKFIRADETGRNKRYIRDYLERLKTAAPDPMSTLRKYNDSGSMDLLKETGLVKYNEDTKSYTLDNEEYKKTLGKAVRTDDEVEEEKKGKKFDSFIVENIYKMSKEKYEERQKRKEEDTKNNPEGKKKSNWNKFWSTVGEKSVNGIDAIYEYGIDGIKTDVNNTISKTKDIYNNVNSMEDLKKVLNDLEIVKSTKNRYYYLKEVKEVLHKTIRESDNPKEFFEEFKKTEGYKKLAITVKDELEELYGKSKIVKDAIVEDITNTNAYKTSKEAVTTLEGLGSKAYNIFRPAVSEFLNKTANKIYNLLDDDKMSEDNKVRIIEGLVKNLSIVYHKLDNMLSEPELDNKKRNEIEKLSKDIKSLHSKLLKFNVGSKNKLSSYIKLSVAYTVESSKYIGDDKVKAILRKTESIITENLTNVGNTLNNAFSRSNENNVANKVEGFIATAKEKANNIKDSIIKKPKEVRSISNISATPTYNTRMPRTVGSTLASATMGRKRSPDEIFKEIETMMLGNKPLMADNLELTNSNPFNEKLLSKINFNTQYYPKELTEDFKDMLRRLNVNDTTLSKLAAFKTVIIATGLPPTLGMYYLPTSPDASFNNSLIINAEVINRYYPNIRYEIHNLIAHEYKHHLQALSGELVVGTDPNHYTNTVTWKNKTYRAAEYLFPFKKYLSSGWEKEAYSEGYNAIYDQLVNENKIDESNTTRKSWIGKMYGKAYKLLKHTIKESIPAVKEDFKNRGIEWLYDSNGNLKDKTPLSSVGDSYSTLASATTMLDDTNLLKPNASMVDGGQTSMTFKDKFRTTFKNVKENVGSTFNKVKETLNLNREEIFDKISSNRFDKLHNDLEDASTDAYKKVLVKKFIDDMYKMLRMLDKVVGDNEKNASLKSKIKALRGKLKELSETDMVDIDKVKSKVDTIKEEINVLADKVVPDDSVLEKKAEEFNKKTVKDDNQTFLEILNSDDPVGALKAKVNNKIKSILKAGLVGTYNFGKKFVKADLERGKKLRGYLKDKASTWYNDRKNGRKGEPGFIRKGLNGGLNLLGTLLGASGKGIKGATLSDLNTGKSMREFFTNMFKKKPKDEKPKEQKNINDKDGDGQTDGSWMSILKKRDAGKANKENLTAKSIAEKAKSPMGIAGIIAVGMMALSAMGITMKDVASFAKGAWDVLKGVGKVLGGVWDTLKTVGGWIKDSFKWIKNKFSFGSDDKEDVKEKIDKDKARIAELMKADKTDTDEYRALVNKVSSNEKKLIELNEEDDTSTSSALGTAAGVGITAYAAKKIYNVGKAGYDMVKGVTNAVGITKTATNKIDAKDVAKKAASNGKIMELLKSFKGYIVKKFKGSAGKKILSNLAKKIASRLVPIAGLALLAYDAAKITYDVMANGTSLKSAISKQILGFDLFSDTDVAVDEDGEIIKPDENLGKTNNTSIVKTKDDEAESDSNGGASMMGTIAGIGIAGYVGKKVYNVGKAGYDMVKGVTNAAGITKNAANKIDAKDVAKKKFSNSKIMTVLRSFKTQITKKFKGGAGKKILVNLAKKIAARAIPIVGLGVLAYDVGKITYDVLVNGTELKSAVSKQILGFDLFSDTDVPKDEHGNEIKPDDNLDITDTTSIVKTKDDKLDKRVEQVDKNIGSNNIVKPNENFTIDKKVEESKPTTSMGSKISSFFSDLKDKAINIKDNVTNKVSVGWEKVKGFVSKGIGSVAAYFESGKAGAGTISSGKGDRGGVSYGTHQLASKTGTLQEYIKGSKYRDEFAGLTPATPAFNAKWKEIYTRDPEGFAQDQEAFIAKSHYLPQVKNLNGIGLDLNNRSDALKSAAFSVGVQFGPDSKLINRAINTNSLDPKKATDEEVIKSIYGYKKNYNDSLFKSSSANVRAGTLKRAYREEAMVLDLLSKEGHKDPVASVQDKVGTEASNNVTYNPETPTATVDTNTANTNTANTNTSVSSTVSDSMPAANTAPTTANTAPVASNITSNISTDINPTATTTPTNISTVDSSAIAAISETNRGLATISTTLSASLEVQRQMLDAIKNLNGSLGDRTLNLSKEEKVEQPTVSNSVSNNEQVQSLGSPNINLARKKYA